MCAGQAGLTWTPDWNVQNNDHFYNFTVNNIPSARSRAEALQLSALEILADTREDRFAHPRIWAPFVVVGEGGRDR